MVARDHTPIILEEFNGLFDRGDKDSCPSDHLSDCENVTNIESGFETRPGIDTLVAIGNIIRLYNYKTPNGDTILALNDSGEIYHATGYDGDNFTLLFGPILSIPAMTDFGFWAVAGRAYISPFGTFVDDNQITYQKGLENEALYVYKGDGTPARAAAGNPPSNPVDTPFIAYNSQIEGLVDKGIHVLAVTYSDGVDDSTGLGTTVLPVVYAPGNLELHVGNLPTTTAVGVTERRIWMTRAIDPEDYDPLNLPTFFLAKVINDLTTVNTIISIADVDLITPFVVGTLPNPTSGGITAETSVIDGFCDLGLHIIGAVYETDTGYLTAPGPETLAVQTFVNEKKAIHVKNIPISPDSFVTKRHLVASKAINNFNGDDRGYQLFFIPEGNLDDNTTTEKIVSFYDLDLLEDASHLIDNFARIPAGVTLTEYQGRMVLTTTFDDISVAYLSAPGEPEAIDQVDGLVIMPLDGNPITNAVEFRGTFYTFKKSRTTGWNDNGDEPSTWVPTPLDQGIGASVHGIAQVLDSGGVNVEFILVVYFGGLYKFNGLYDNIPLSWKIDNRWKALDKNDFANIQIMNDTLNKFLYLTLPDKKMLHADYNNGLDFKNIKWWPWRFDIETNTIALIFTDTLVIGSVQAL